MSRVITAIETGRRRLDRHGRTKLLLLLTIGLQSISERAAADSPAPPKAETQATIKRLGFGISEIILLSKAARRIDVHASEISQDPSGMKIVPYSSLIYDLDGDAWVYKLTGPLSYVRDQVIVDHIMGDQVFLKEGPPPGTQVVTVGVPELYGTEVGVNGE